MVRFAIIAVVVSVAFVLYALVDAAMSDSARARGLSKPAWVVLIALLPVVGAALWFFIGKGSGQPQPFERAPEDDPSFAAGHLSADEIDAHVQELEERLRELDNEVFPDIGETRHAASTDEAAPETGASAPGDPTSLDEGEDPGDPASGEPQ